jgi:hypothetical protein
MKYLWIINLITWGAVIVYMFPAAWSAVTGKGLRAFDHIRLAYLATAVMMSSFSVRWLFFPDNIALWTICYILSAGVAVYIIALSHAYGRGAGVGN